MDNSQQQNGTHDSKKLFYQSSLSNGIYGTYIYNHQELWKIIMNQYNAKQTNSFVLYSDGSAKIKRVTCAYPAHSLQIIKFNDQAFYDKWVNVINAHLPPLSNEPLEYPTPNDAEVDPANGVYKADEILDTDKLMDLIGGASEMHGRSKSIRRNKQKY